MANDIYRQILNQKIEQFIGTFESAEILFKDKDKKLFHPGELGSYREETCKELLKVFVNRTHGISDGFIITADNVVSTQCDVIIHNSNVVPWMSNGVLKFFPVEEVNAVLEIKSKVRKSELKEALRKLAKIKMLSSSRVRERMKNNDLYTENETDLIATYLICGKSSISFKKLDLKDIYQGIPQKYWHNGILSIEDGYCGYYQSLVDMPMKMYERERKKCDASVSGFWWEYPLFSQGEEISFSKPAVCSVEKDDKYAHILQFIVSLEKNLQSERKYQMDSIRYLGYEVKYREKTLENVLTELQKEGVSRLNQILGTSYRNKPYEIEKPEDAEEYLKLISGAYLDFLDYWLQLENLIERFDESNEVYAPSEWAESLDGEESVYTDTLELLEQSADSMRDIVDIWEEKLKKFVQGILKKEDEFKKKVLGYEYVHSRQYADKIMEQFFENVTEMERFYGQEQNFDSVLKHLKKSYEYVVAEEEE